jgi:hypothetical protein
MDSEKRGKVDGHKLALVIFEAAMAFFYLAFGVIFLFPFLFHAVFKYMAMADGLRYTFGAILSFYGIYRILRVAGKIGRKKDSN